MSIVLVLFVEGMQVCKFVLFVGSVENVVCVMLCVVLGIIVKMEYVCFLIKIIFEEKLRKLLLKVLVMIIVFWMGILEELFCF